MEPREGRAPFLVVMLNGVIHPIEKQETRIIDEKLEVKKLYALPVNVQRDLENWYHRVYNRIRKLPNVKFGKTVLYPASCYQEIKEILDDAKREFEEFRSQLEEKYRDRISFSPVVAQVNFDEEFLDNLKEVITNELLQEFNEELKTIILKIREKVNEKFRDSISDQFTDFFEDLDLSISYLGNNFVDKVVSLLNEIEDVKKKTKIIENIKEEIRKISTFSSVLKEDAVTLLENLTEKLDKILLSLPQEILDEVEKKRRKEVSERGAYGHEREKLMETALLEAS